MSKKKTYLIASLVSAFLLLPIIVLFVFAYLSTRQHTPDLTGYAQNPNIPCVQYDYDLTGELGDLKDGARSFSEICPLYPVESNDFLGSELLSDYESYAAVIAKIKENEERFQLSESGSIAADEIDPAFFQEHDILMVSFVADFAAKFYPRLDHLNVSDSAASIDLQYDLEYIVIGSNRGVLYLVPIPKGCTSSNVNLVYVTDWTDLKN